MSERVVIIDGQAHCWRLFDPRVWLTAAQRNFERAVQRLGRDCEMAHAVIICASAPGAYALPELLPYWHQCSLEKIESRDGRLSAVWVKTAGRITLLLVAARQVETKDRIEVLALTPDPIPTREQALASLLSDLASAAAPAIVPWGVGKWLGARGVSVRQTLLGSNLTRSALIGDIGGRPWIWPRSRVLRTLACHGYRVLDGTDPLPVKDDQERVGSYGSWFEGNLGLSEPLAELTKYLFDPEVQLESYGSASGVIEFARAQLTLRFQKRKS